MVVTEEVEVWRRFGTVDRKSPFLRDTSGAAVTFAELEQSTGSRYAAQAELDHMSDQAVEVRRAVERLRADVAEARPDLFVVIGDDQMELHDFDNMPALGVFYGDELVMATRSRFASYYDDMADVLPEVSAGYGMDAHHVWPGHAPFAQHLIASLMSQRFDVAAMKEVSDPTRGGIGHAFGVVEAQLMGETKTPLVPLYVNNYWPPNQLPPSRCYELGRALRRAIDDYPGDLRVAVVASGGLSHFITDEELDNRVLDALRSGDHEALCAIPEHLLNSGNSEIRNWFTLAAACADRHVAWDAYHPVYRTPAGTGCGLAFLRY
jgi:3-O-methylgallate 3,4-dioxygenase